MLNGLGFSDRDMLAVAVFFLSWFVHTWVVQRSPLKHRTISSRMFRFRLQWMSNMVAREPKMVDTLIQNGLQQGVLFFASTSILIIGALLAGLGSSEQALEFLVELPFATETSRTVWELKVVLVTFIFMFSFFKFAWSFRQFNYVLILIGAARDTSDSDSDGVTAKFVQTLAQMHSQAAQHFTTGINAYFFALAAFAWFINAWCFIAATIWVLLVLFRRAFFSSFGQQLGTIT